MKKIKMSRCVKLTFEEGCNKYLENCRQRNLREGTIWCKKIKGQRTPYKNRELSLKSLFVFCLAALFYHRFFNLYILFIFF